MERKEVIKIKILQVLSHAGDEEGTFRSSRGWLANGLPLSSSPLADRQGRRRGGGEGGAIAQRAFNSPKNTQEYFNFWLKKT